MRSNSNPNFSGRPKRLSVRLAHNLEKDLASYATVLGVGLTALAQPLSAEIVYTPSNIPIIQNGKLVALDLNHDGIADFQFAERLIGTSLHGTWSLKLSPARSANEIFSTSKNKKRTAAALPNSFQVGPSPEFQPGTLNLQRNRQFSSTGYSSSGNWLHVEFSYVGLKFVVNGEAHYGWARVKFDIPGDWTRASLAGYAYETIPNQPILTGKTSGTEIVQDTSRVPRARGSLGMLAVGALGIGAWPEAKDASPLK